MLLCRSLCGKGGAPLRAEALYEPFSTMSNEPIIFERLLEDFVLLDCPLRQHPRVSGVLHLLEGDLLVPVAATGEAKGRVLARSFPVQSSRSLYFVRNQEAIGLSNYAEYASPFYEFGSYPIRSMLAVPVGGTVGIGIPLGVLSFLSTIPETFNRGHIGRAQIIAEVLAYCWVQTRTQSKIRHYAPAAINLGKALRRIREESSLPRSRVARLAGVSKTLLSQWEAGLHPPSSGSLLNWCKALGLISTGPSTMVTPVDITPDIIRFLKEDPQRLMQLSPEQFENFVAERLDRMGFDVTLTGNTTMRDGGIDLIGVPKLRGVASFIIAAQIKHHSAEGKTGRSAVDRLLAWKGSAFQMGLLVTNTSFTRDALWVAAQDIHKGFLRLRDFDDLRRWLQDNFWSQVDWREIPREITLAPGVTIAIPKAELRDSHDIWPRPVVEYRDSACPEAEERITPRSSGRKPQKTRSCRSPPSS